MTATTLQRNQALDLTQAPPRSPNDLLGDYVILARTIDKCRATLAGTQGGYHWNCPLAHVFFDFKGIDPMDFEAQVKADKTDEEILAWVNQTGIPRSEDDILAWSYDARNWVPDTPEKKAYLEKTMRQIRPDNLYARTFFEMLDIEEGRRTV